MIVIDKKTLKLLKYIQKKDNPTARQILKYGKYSSDFLLVALCQNGYLVCTKDDKSLTQFIDEPLPIHTTHSYRYWATPLTNKYIEDYDSKIRSWSLPTLISFISLVISIFTFFYTIMDKSPILVKLIG
ncbi:MAG: hypothetical protein H2184_04235 [Candidatus Galacturonibacter soehngenii]|nr:hypothetical protein [Candidatus Galacturonibacter soehngenii]